MGATMHMMMMCCSSTDYPTLLCWKCFHGAFVSAAWMESSQETSSSCVWCSHLQQWDWSSGDSFTGVVLFFLSSSVVAFVAFHCCCICWVVASLEEEERKAHETTLSVFCAALCVFSDDHSSLFCFHEFLKLLRCQKGGIVPCKVSKGFLYCFVFVGM